jgi:pimeloyl-ACP methyl ester carboxylesterase
MEDARRRLSLTTARELAVANPLYVQAALTGAARSDLPGTGTLRQLDMPTIIFSWEGDRTHPVSTAKILADTLPNVHSLIISESEDTDNWTDKLCGFLDQLNTGSRRKSAA